MKILMSIMLALIMTIVIAAQSTTFTYQGRLNDTATAANGSYDFEFRLFDAVSGGSQKGTAVQFQNVAVKDGVFTVQLDFGNNFPGSERFLDISVRPAGGGAFNGLSPRQQLTSVPYAVKSISAATADTAGNAAQLGGLPSSQYVQTNDARLSDARTPTYGSPNYIQNQTVTQANANFHISGNGIVDATLYGNVVNATTQFNIGDKRVLSVSGTNNVFLGFASGSATTSGNNNSFAGENAGASDTTGSLNSFFGSNAGQTNASGGNNSFFGNSSGSSSTGSNNSFYGSGSGRNNSSGFNNSFFGKEAGFNAGASNNNAFFGYTAGYSNTGNFNSFFGPATGQSNTSGIGNTFVGDHSGSNNDSGSGNAFFGRNSGDTNLTGSNNTVIGVNANVLSNNLTNATAIGYQAVVGQSNALVLGGINGVNGATADTKVGIGTAVPSERLTIQTASNSYGWVHTQGAITFGSYVGGSSGQPFGGWIGTKTNHPLSFFVNNGGAVLSIETSGFVRLNNVDAGGQLQLCLGPSNHISFCSSSLRYKTNVAAFTPGLNVIRQLKPITFDWKEGGTNDLGLGAEDVAKVNELLVIRNKKGEVEGVKYDRIGVVLVNAVKEQQAQIEMQTKLISDLERRLERVERTHRANKTKKRRSSNVNKYR